MRLSGNNSELHREQRGSAAAAGASLTRAVIRAQFSLPTPFGSILTRTLVAARTKLVHITTDLSNQIRGLMKTFGLVVPPGKGSKFQEHVRELVIDRDGLAAIVVPLLEAWRSIRLRAARMRMGSPTALCTW